MATSNSNDHYNPQRLVSWESNIFHVRLKDHPLASVIRSGQKVQKLIVCCIIICIHILTEHHPGVKISHLIFSYIAQHHASTLNYFFSTGGVVVFHRWATKEAHSLICQVLREYYGSSAITERISSASSSSKEKTHLSYTWWYLIYAAQNVSQLICDNP